MSEFSIQQFMDAKYPSASLPPNVTTREIPKEQLEREEKFKRDLAERLARVAAEAAEELRVADEARQAEQERATAEATRLAGTAAGQLIKQKYGYAAKGTSK